MRLRSITFFLLLLATAACSANRIEFDANPPYAPHFYRKFDVEVTWQASRTGRDISLTGTVTNLRDQFMCELDLTARLLNEKGDVLAEETFTGFPRFIPSGKAAPFNMKIRLPEGSAPARLRLSYAYWLADEPPSFLGYAGYGDIPHFGNFYAPL